MLLESGNNLVTLKKIKHCMADFSQNITNAPECNKSFKVMTAEQIKPQKIPFLNQ